MPLERDHAIVLRLTEYSESSQIATLFAADHGLLRLIAKGIRRGTATRFAVGLDLLESGDVQYTPARGDATLGTLTDWTQRAAFAGLRAGLAGVYGGQYAAELTAALTEEGDPHRSLFDALHRLLTDLTDGQCPTPALARFQFELLESIGYGPSLDRCTSCQNAPPADQPAYFSTAAGGLVCRDCEVHYVEKRDLPAACRWGEPPAGDSLAWFDLLAYHIRNLLGHEPKAFAALATTLRREAPPRRN